MTWEIMGKSWENDGKCRWSTFTTCLQIAMFKCPGAYSEGPTSERCPVKEKTSMPSLKGLTVMDWSSMRGRKFLKAPENAWQASPKFPNIEKHNQIQKHCSIFYMCLRFGTPTIDIAVPIHAPPINFQVLVSSFSSSRPP